jgi:hypothetical protein
LDEPTPEDLFGIFGIFPSFCESKLGQKFVKCLNSAPVAAPTSKGMGKRQRVLVDDKAEEDLLQAFHALSGDEKKQLLAAMEQDDIELVDAILDRRQLLNINEMDEPTPEDLLGIFGIFPSFCESKLGQKFVKCLNSAPVAAPTSKGMMGTGMGKRQRILVDDKAEEDLLQAFHALSGDEKKQLLAAMEQDDIELVDAIWAGLL